MFASRNSELGGVSGGGTRWHGAMGMDRCALGRHSPLLFVELISEANTTRHNGIRPATLHWCGSAPPPSKRRLPMSEKE
mgnify:CR=1 FL=1